MAVYKGVEPFSSDRQSEILTDKLIDLNWYQERDSNPYAHNGQEILSLLCLALPSSWLKILAGKVGLEPTTHRLTADCSAFELHPNKNYFNLL